ncbi:MAG: hypothetical protein ABIR54_16295 [Burkholderiaceae bacterium]
MTDETLACAQHATSNRNALVCDEGESAWLYLTEADAEAIAADCWMFNTVAAPASLAGFTDRKRPPPATSRFSKILEASPMPPTSDVTISWSADGQSPCVSVAGVALAFVDGRTGHGYCANLQESGPFGHCFDDELHRELFGVA